MENLTAAEDSDTRFAVAPSWVEGAELSAAIRVELVLNALIVLLFWACCRLRAVLPVAAGDRVDDRIDC